MKHLSCKLSNLTATEEGAFTGLASVYGNIDQQGDVVKRGAFTKTLQESGGRVVLLWQHDPSQPVGMAQLQDTPRGLAITGSLVLETERGREAHALLKRGIISGLSIGFQTIKSHQESGARSLDEVQLWEVSLVTFPANTAARVQTVKHADAAELLAAFRALALDARIVAAQHRLDRLAAKF